MNLTSKVDVDIAINCIGLSYKLARPCHKLCSEDPRVPYQIFVLINAGQRQGTAERVTSYPMEFRQI